MYSWEGFYFKFKNNDEYLKIVSIYFPLGANPYVLDMQSENEETTVFIDDYPGDEEPMPIAIIIKTELQYKITFSIIKDKIVQTNNLGLINVEPEETITQYCNFTNFEQDINFEFDMPPLQWNPVLIIDIEREKELRGKLFYSIDGNIYGKIALIPNHPYFAIQKRKICNKEVYMFLYFTIREDGKVVKSIKNSVVFGYKYYG